MLIALACGLSSDAFATDGTNGFSTIGVKSDDYLYSCAVQGIFECGQVAVTEYVASRVEPTDTRIVMTTDMEMSYQHDGLIMFVCRVMRPLWYSKSIGRRVITRSSSSRDRRSPSISYELEYSREQLEEIREVLFQLRQLMEGTGPYAVSISNSAVLEQSEDVVGASSDSSRVAELASRYQRQRTEDQLRREKRLKAEQRSLYFVYEMILRSIEGISLLRTCLEMNVPLEEKAARMSFSEFICSSEGTVAARDMIKSLIKSRGTENSSEILIRQIREECPAFFSVADLWQYQGYQSLTTAKMSIPSGKKQHLKESLNQFLSSCYMWTTEDSIEVLQNICEDYAMLGFYEGVVKLSLACAKNFIEENFENSKLGSASLLKLRRSCFACILLILQRLLGEEEIESNGTMNMKTQKKQRRVEANPEDSIEKMVSLDEDTKKNALEQLFHFALVSKDQEFHELLYSWLYQNGHKKLLTRLRSPFLEEFLKQQDQELLIKLYMDQKKYLVAAKVWWNRAHETDDNILENNPDLNKRQYYVSKALGCLKSTEEMVSTQKETSSTLDAIKEVSDVLDVLQLQMRILNSLEQSTSEMEASATLSLDKLDERKNNIKELTYKVFDASTLYNNFAAKYDMWTECLYIIHTCNSEEPEIVSSLWRKIIYSLIPTSSSNSDFNVWRADHCEFAGLSTQSFSSSSFESGAWIGQLQCKLLRLGKSFYNDAGGAQSTNVFPVGFLAKELERISSWFVRLTQTNQNQKEAFASSIETSALTWVLKTFLDIGVPHRIVLSYYERMYHEQGTLNWVTHILSSIYVIITLWKKNAMSPRAGREALEEFAAACPHLVDCCEEFITELKAIPLGTLIFFYSSFIILNSLLLFIYSYILQLSIARCMLSYRSKFEYLLVIRSVPKTQE
jgi:nuclear pore complex protein Nup155